MLQCYFTLTSDFPVLSPLNIPIKAAGADSNPLFTCSTYFNFPSLIHSKFCKMPSIVRSAYLFTRKPSNFSSLPTINPCKIVAGK